MTEETTIVIDGQKEVFNPKEKLPDVGADIFSYLVESGTTVPAWWSSRRDVELRKFWHSNDHVAGAFYAFVSRLTSVPIRVVAKDQSVKTHVEQAKEYTDLLWYATTSRSDVATSGWVHGWGMFLQDLLTQDNGAFFIVEGPGRSDGPLTGRPTKLIHLDSQKVTRKSDKEFPIVYENFDGKLYKIHESRVIAMSSLPSTQQRMYGVGFCALSRCINYAQVLTDILIYKQEKLGSRPKERIIIGKKGITSEDIARAFMVADDQMNSMGLSRYAKTVVIAPNIRSSSAEVDLSVEDLVDAGQIFDEGQSLMLGMNTIALALGVPTRWLWPATATGATKADAQYQHLAGMVQGPGEIIRAVRLALESKFLPPQLTISVDYQDDEQDRQQAEIRNTRAGQRKTDIGDEVITIRVAREQALNAGDITSAQFDQMELDDGRLPSGDPIVALFDTKDEYTRGLLNLGVKNPVDINANDPVDMLIVLDKAAFVAMKETQVASSFQRKSAARQALAALAIVKDMYSQRAFDEMTAELVEEINAQTPTEPGAVPPPAAPAAAEEPTAEQPSLQPGMPETTPGQQEEAEKAYNFGVGGGEVIGGNLARGPDGRFISKDEMSAAIRARLLDRLRGKTTDEVSADLPPEENRIAVLAELMARFPNFPIGGMDGVNLLGQGMAPDPATANALVGQGLAKINDDGSVQLTSQGASFLIAANKGDQPKAEEALIRAQAAKVVPKPASGGGAAAAAAKPKAEPEEEKPDKEQIATDNRTEISESIGVDLNGLQAFSDGDELDAETSMALAADGLVEFDSDGKPRLTSSGRSVLSAGNSGDSRKAEDALSRAREGVQKKRDRVAGLREKADNARADIEAAQASMNELVGLDQDAAEAKIAGLEKKIATLEKAATEAENDAAKIEKSIGGAVEEAEEVVPEAKKSIVERVKELFKKKLSISSARSDYQSGIRRAVRGFWAGHFIRDSFLDSMEATIDRGIRGAWRIGLEKAGILESEMTEEETSALNDFILNQFRYIGGFADDIEEGKKGSGKLGGFLTRSDMWVNAFDGAVNQAFVMAAKDKKVRFVLGPTSDHCEDCEKYNGRVYRGSIWEKHDIRPQSYRLSCHGFRCLCYFEETDDPVTPGYPPRPKN